MDSAPIPLVLGIFPFAFAGMWMGVTSLLSALAGHPRALARFPPDPTDPVQPFHFASARGPRFVNFNSALYVGVGRRGLHLAPNPLFRPPWWWGVPCIPWTEVEVEGERTWFFSKVVRLRILSLGLTWDIRGAAGQAILAATGRDRA